jgi:Site-specific recombinases, DNA invertase Pin homologs
MKATQKDMDIKIGIYCRVSSREQAIYGYGIDVQKDKIESYLKLFDIQYTSKEYYVDDGVSAKNLERAEIKRLIQDIKDKKVNVVYIYKLDRLSRSVVDMYNLITMFTENDCNLVAIMDNIDVNSANGRLFVGIMAIISQWERETILERTKDGVEEMVKSGKYPYGARPYGWNKKEDLTLEINQEEAKIIRFINQKAREGAVIKEIEKMIMEEFGIFMSAERIRELINRDWYFGEFVYQKNLYTDIFPKILSKQDALEARKIISKRYKKYDDNRYYYGNKVVCTCGEILEHKSTKKKNGVRYFYYYCNKCKKRINQNAIIDNTLYSIASRVSEFETEKNTTKMVKRLDGLNTKIHDIHNKFINNGLDINVYLMSLYNLEYEKQEVIAKIKTKNVLDYIKWNSMSDLERKQFINNHIKKIVVDTKNQIVIDVEYIEKD